MDFCCYLWYNIAFTGGSMKDNVFTKEQLHELFYYENGKLFWKDLRFKKGAKKGKASWRCKTGYEYINIGKDKFKQARFIWIMFNGNTDNLVDHINGVRHDDRIENLREASPSENMFNKARGKKSNTGYRGVTKCKWTGRFVAEIRAKNKRVFFKRFDTPEEANEACLAARKQFHKEFAKHD